MDSIDDCCESQTKIKQPNWAISCVFSYKYHLRVSIVVYHLSEKRYSHERQHLRWFELYLESLN